MGVGVIASYSACAGGGATGGAAILMYSCSTAASRMADAIGPASLPPAPPYSTMTAKAIFGLFAGAKPMNHAWPSSVPLLPLPRYQGISGLGASGVLGGGKRRMMWLFSSRLGLPFSSY